MILSASNSRWQTVIADLSLILFLVAASALEADPEPVPAVETAATAPPAAGTQADLAAAQPTDIALTVWSDAPGSIALGQWLAEQAPDDGQRLSITITYSAGRLAEAIARATQTRLESGAAGADARIIIAQGQADNVQVRLVQEEPATQSGPDIAY